jgi:hypothetical protein
MTKKVKAVVDGTPIITGVTPIPVDVVMPDDIVQLCGMITTDVSEGRVNKTGLITSKEKLEKLVKLPGIEVVRANFDTIKIRGHEVIAKVSMDRVVTIRTIETKNENNNSENNPNNKENGKMEKENKVETNNTNNETTNNAAAATPVAEPVATTAPDTPAALPAPSPQALANAKAMHDALISAREEIDEAHPFWKDALKAAGIGAATAVGVLGVCALYNCFFGEE